jgi:hypothetical protein
MFCPPLLPPGHLKIRCLRPTECLPPALLIFMHLTIEGGAATCHAYAATNGRAPDSGLLLRSFHFQPLNSSIDGGNCMASTSFRAALALLIASLTAAIAFTPAKAQQLTGSKRLALVIGNSGYQNVARLINPVNDATDIAAKLKELNFEVLLGTDITHAKMTALLEEFKAKVTREHVALVFYAGHGVTVNRESFLLPVDTPATIEVDDKSELRGDAANRAMVSMASVLAPLETSRIGIVFLDACRNSATDTSLGMTARMVSLGQTRNVPVVRGTGSLEIKPSPHSAGVFRAYATQLNNVASDGAGRNSPFTKALLKHIGTKGISIQDLMIRVRKSVMEETGNEQIPWEEAALNEPFSFVQAALTGSSAGGSTGQRTNNSAAAKPAAPRKTNLPPNLGVGIGSGL